MNDSASQFFKKLTWNDIRIWAGETITARGRDYQRRHAVQDLSLTPDGELLAWVNGTESYATHVIIRDEKLFSHCTCPYGSTCKHGVAVVLEYLEKLKNNSEIRIVGENDQRLAMLDGRPHSRAHDLEDLFQEEDNLDREESSSRLPASSKKENWGSGPLHAFLEKQNKAQLIAFLETIVERYPAAKDFMIDHFQVSQGEVGKLVKSIRKEIDRVSAEPAWTQSWDGEGEIPDYSEVRNRLEMLSTQGHPDEVLTIGKYLLERGINKVEQSNDEGETAEEIASCMNIVFQALSGSSLAPAQQMLWAVEADLQDEYELTAGSDVFWDLEHQPSDWSALADSLWQRFRNISTIRMEDQFSQNYDRDNLCDWIVDALEYAGRQEEIIPLLEQEAEITKSYVRLVERLIQVGRSSEAEEWIQRGIRATDQKSAGIASRLRIILRGMREKEGDWLTAAAFHADDFFVRPDIANFKVLRQGAETAGVWPAVRTALMHYLESGNLPAKQTRIDKGQTIPPWPLPETGLREAINKKGSEFPMTRTLLDIAIEEKRPQEILHWYDSQTSRDLGGWSYSGNDDEVAEAVSGVYPERSTSIWKRLAENQIAQTKPSAYEQAGVYLNKLGHLLQRLGKENEWRAYLVDLRLANARKKRCLQVLNSLSLKPIIES